MSFSLLDEKADTGPLFLYREKGKKNVFKLYEMDKSARHLHHSHIPSAAAGTRKRISCRSSMYNEGGGLCLEDLYNVLSHMVQTSILLNS